MCDCGRSHFFDADVVLEGNGSREAGGPTGALLVSWVGVHCPPPRPAPAGLCSVPGLDRVGQVQGPRSALRTGSPSFSSPALRPSSPFCAVEMEASPSLVLQIACSAASGQWKVLSPLECRPLSDPLRLPHRSHFPAQVSCVFALLGCLFRDWVCSRACGLSE